MSELAVPPDPPVPGGQVTGKYPPRNRNRDRLDWQLCKKCGSRHPEAAFTTFEGELRKTCNNCRANRNKRRVGCTCNRCSYCKRRALLAERAAEQASDMVYSYKYDSWEIMGGSNAYFLPIRKPLREIANLYDFSS